MKRLIIIISILMFCYSGSTLAGNSSCIDCHLSSDWVADTTITAKFLDGDIHYNAGVGCVDCHGGDHKIGFDEGDPDLAMNPAKGYKDPPSRKRIPEFCADCHSDIEYMKKYDPKLPTDQLKLYKTSVLTEQPLLKLPVRKTLNFLLSD